MRTRGIVGHRPRRRRDLTKADETAAPAPDLIGRLFDPDRADVAWCGDITYIPTDEAWMRRVLLTTLRKQRPNERRDIGRARRALQTVPRAARSWRMT